ncbi:hypothetical protein O181_061828 [Austropuccinia psidii MF-1]|uniref:Uncharacterized protein n=1 Tax=Austropuccinia psidii MF-1 TaxID=1389203 RepID=A0A9Q3HYY4_9BASI|nr:hypothetical protein [Austropuccinia psidii MF-1]
MKATIKFKNRAGKGRGKTRTRSGRPSSRKAHLEDARVTPISQVAYIEIYQSQDKDWYRATKEEEWKICPSLWQGAMNSYLHIKSFLSQKNNIELLGGWCHLSYKEKIKKIKNWLKNQSLLSVDQKKELEMTPGLEESPVASRSSKPAPETSKEKPKGPQRK